MHFVHIWPDLRSKPCGVFDTRVHNWPTLPGGCNRRAKLFSNALGMGTTGMFTLGKLPDLKNPCPEANSQWGIGERRLWRAHRDAWRHSEPLHLQDSLPLEGRVDCKQGSYVLTHTYLHLLTLTYFDLL